MENNLINITEKIEELLKEYNPYVSDVKIKKESLEELVKLIVKELIELDANIFELAWNVLNTRLLAKPFYTQKSALKVSDPSIKQKMDYYRKITEKNDTLNIEEMFAPILLKTLVKKIGNAPITMETVEEILLPAAMEVNNNINTYFNKQSLIINIINSFIFQQTWYAITNLYNVGFFSKIFDSYFAEEYKRLTDFTVSYYNISDTYKL